MSIQAISKLLGLDRKNGAEEFTETGGHAGVRSTAKEASKLDRF